MHCRIFQLTIIILFTSILFCKEYTLTVIADGSYRQLDSFEQRIEESIAFMNQEYSAFDISFVYDEILEDEISDETYIKGYTFWELNSNYDKTDMVIFYTAKDFKYFAGKASSSYAVIVMASKTSSPEYEKKVIVHEMGHIFELSHVRNADANNYMQSGGKAEIFIPEHISLINETKRMRDFKEFSPKSLLRYKIPMQEEILNNYETDHWIFTNLGWSYLELGKKDKAAYYFQKELDYLKDLLPCPKDSVIDWFIGCYSGLASVELKNWNFDKAIEYADSAIAWDSQDPDLWLIKGGVYNYGHKPTNEYFIKALELKPDYEPALNSLIGYSRDRDKKMYDKYLNQLKSINPETYEKHIKHDKNLRLWSLSFTGAYIIYIFYMISQQLVTVTIN